MSKSGEILRIGHGDYSFLCVHCGFTFVDIKEILNHIDYHFDMMDIKVANPDTTNYVDTTTHPIQQLFVDEIKFSEDIRPEIKVENDKETWPEIKTDESVKEHQPGINSFVNEDLQTFTGLLRSNKKRTKNIVKKKRKCEVKNECDVKVDCRQCPICELNFASSLRCQKHLKTAHQISSTVFQCYICGLYFKNLTVLKAHLGRAFHSKQNCYQCELDPPITKETDPRPHKCLFCKEWLENHLLFRKHFKDVHQREASQFFSKKSNCSEFSCYICKKDFTHKFYLKNHMLMHNNIKPFICDVCGLSYRTKAVLKRHLDIHKGKSCTCELCGKTFAYYARLRIHRYSHRTELNYKCTVCSKAFKIQKYLARHMKIHREEKTFPCRYCEKRFTFSTGRRAHEISQHHVM